ncbi:restriction endonuclease [Clostridium felsineum]|uniref:restriction endonuclease n=1 Tax=Clostridium felsineum TaxID=36839 RepID=UPI00214D395F|nr:restriction endonuclease [Clostridium felsineum]MCR3758441.1 restriction endonuclease [Clostridium felsineum]
MSKRRMKARRRKLYLEVLISTVGLIVCYMKVKKVPFENSLGSIRNVMIIVMAFLFFVILVRFLYKQLLNNRTASKYLNSSINIIDKMTGQEFERFLKAHFEKLGYKVELTPKTGDYGADLVINKKGCKTVVQAKRWINKVGIEAVQQVIASKSYYKADKCLVVTNNYFTPNAINLSESNKDVELWDRKELIKIMNKNNPTINNSSEISKRVLCPKCGKEMKLIHGKNGDFYGCSNYPKCKGTRRCSTSEK